MKKPETHFFYLRAIFGAKDEFFSLISIHQRVILIIYWSNGEKKKTVAENVNLN